jgi:hypothetical protein
MSTAGATPSETGDPATPRRAGRPELTVLCAIEPALASFAAARQAATLAGGGTLDLVAVQLRGDRSPDAHLAAARFIAARAGAAPGVIRLDGADAVARLLATAAEYDVLVVVDRRDDGARSRLAEIAVRRARCSVLVARGRSGLRGFPQPVPRCPRMARPGRGHSVGA